MAESERDRPAFHVGGNATGQFVFGDNNTVTSQAAPPPVDVAGLTRFAAAVIEALPSLRLDEEEHHRVRQLAAEIMREAEAPGQDSGRLPALGRSLRSIIENAAAGALASGLLSIWLP
ncbi:hypothetical protein [Actinomadura roseirufa]|uniref:hypothetical protein n=1 Tax=Actinomadura roseirufa TaxID=2094049 RepID=UPI0010413846|nr:hypothetical protein [Actinomadura roseirufa]